MMKRIEPASPGGARAVKPVAQVLALRQRDPWREATERARQVALSREGVVVYIRSLIDSGVTQNNAVGLLIERGLAGALPVHVATMLAGAAKAGRSAPSRSAICEWCALHREGGITALLPDHKGRVVEAAGWWGPALEYFNVPSKPDMSAVYRRLVEVDHFAVTYDQVRGYLTGVPAMLGRNSPARIGKKLYKLTEKAFIRRSTANALPGDVYVADGYRVDKYLAHPVTGDIWRPELTVAMDMRSRMPVHWRADEHEGTYAVQNMWAECFAKWNHVPPFLYVDNGSGYKNFLMSDEAVGFYARAGIQQVIHAIPGNPHGKGWIERFFRSMRDDFLKLWHPELYCGDDMAPEALNHTVAEIKAGRLKLPSLAEFSDALNAWIARYISRPHPEDASVTRAELWAQLVPIPPCGSVTELKRQAVTLTVRRASIKHGKREYSHPDLHAFNGEKLVMEYDLMDDRIAVMRTHNGRWICDANLIVAMDAIAPNRLEEKRQHRVDDAMKRLQKKMDEQQARSGRVIDADAVADGAALEGTATRLLGDAGDDEINLFDI
jgi:putative transposase